MVRLWDHLFGLPSAKVSYRAITDSVYEGIFHFLGVSFFFSQVHLFPDCLFMVCWSQVIPMFSGISHNDISREIQTPLLTSAYRRCPPIV